MIKKQLSARRRADLAKNRAGPRFDGCPAIRLVDHRRPFAEEGYSGVDHRPAGRQSLVPATPCGPQA